MADDSQPSVADDGSPDWEKEMLVALGERIRAVREARGLTIHAFAQMGGVKKNSQINYEAGRTAVQVDYLLRLAEHGVDAVYLLTGKRALTAERAAETLRIAASADADETRSPYRSQLVEIAMDQSLPDRVRAEADLHLRLRFSDPAAEARHAQRSRRSREEARRAEMLVDDACRGAGWIPPTTLRGDLVKLVNYYGVDVGMIDQLIYDLKQIAEGG